MAKTKKFHAPDAQLEVGDRVWSSLGPYEVQVEVAKVVDNGAVFVYPHTLTHGVNVRWQDGYAGHRVPIQDFGKIAQPTPDMFWWGRAVWDFKPE